MVNMNKKLFSQVKSVYSRYNNPVLTLMKKGYLHSKKKKISLAPYDRQYPMIYDDLHREIDKVLSFSSDEEFWFYEKDFEKKFAKFCGKRFATGVSSGTAALQIALLSLGIGEGDEVITVPNTYIATALAISNVGAKPVFVDIEPETYNIDPDKIEEKVTERTKAIMPVHLYGHSCEMKRIINIAKKHKLSIVEDCAHAHGSLYNNRPVPTGDVGCFSFYMNKILNGIGDGGIIVTDSKKVKLFSDTVKNPDVDTPLIRLSKRSPCTLNGIQIAFLSTKFKHLQEWIRLRRENARVYNELLGKAHVGTPVEKKWAKHVYFSYVIQSHERDLLKKFLSRNRIETKVMYEKPLHLTHAYAYLGYKKGDFPVTEECNKKILSLPISSFLKESEVQKVADTIKLFDKKF